MIDMAEKKNQLCNDRDTVDHLYQRYYFLVKSEKPMVWKDFQEFLEWAKKTYEPGTALRRIDESKPYGPTNCEWAPMGINERYQAKLAAQWDAAMEPIRKRYAEYLKRIQPRKKEYFRYEHPDLVREGIVFEGSGSV